MYSCIPCHHEREIFVQCSNFFETFASCIKRIISLRVRRPCRRLEKNEGDARRIKERVSPVLRDEDLSTTQFPKHVHHRLHRRLIGDENRGSIDEFVQLENLRGLQSDRCSTHSQGRRLSPFVHQVGHRDHGDLAVEQRSRLREGQLRFPRLEHGEKITTLHLTDDTREVFADDHRIDRMRMMTNHRIDLSNGHPVLHDTRQGKILSARSDRFARLQSETKALAIL